jgi:serine/threonine protein kinase
MLEIGQTVGNYRIVRKIDEGGMGAVYEGVHDQIDRHVAIKVLHSDLSQDSQFVRRLANEARAVNIIKHPGIVEISDFGQIPGGSPYIVMEFLDGESLDRRLRRRGKLTAEETALIGYQVASALTAAHTKGIIHRDMKPDNVMLVSLSDGEGERVKILDFGIAKLREEHEQAEQAKAGKLTQTGTVMGTPHYISPEQCQEARLVDERADVYSLGAMLFHMLAGEPPFDGNTAPLIMLKHLNNQPPELARLNPKLPPALTELIARMLRKLPKERPAMSEVAEVLLGLCDRQVALRLAPTPLSLSMSGQVPVPGRVSGQVTAVTGRVSGQLTAVPGATRTSGQVTAVRDSYESLVVEAEAPLPAHKTTAFTRRRPLIRRLLIGLTVLSVGAAVGGYFLQTRVLSRTQERQARVASATPEPTLVQVAVRSEPPGALVLRQPDQLPLGRTPWQSRQPRGGVLRLTLRLPGHLDREVILFLDQDGERTERLDRAPGHMGQPGAKEPPRRPSGQPAQKAAPRRTR